MFHSFMSAIVGFSILLLVPAPMSKNFWDTKMITDFLLSHYIVLNNTSAKQLFLVRENDTSWYNLYFPDPWITVLERNA